VATVCLAGESEPVNMRIRVTEAYRLVDGAWRMIHRHADMPAPKP
jgi:hypothetical protein